MNKIFLISLCVLSSCKESPKDKILDEKHFEIKKGDNTNGYEEFQIKSPKGILFNFYLDKDGNIIQISDSTTQKFRVVFDNKGLIQLVDNKFSELKKRSYQFDNLKNNIVISDENGRMFREIRLFNLGTNTPVVDYSESRVHDKMYFLSQYASFDFNSWQDASPLSRENIVLKQKPERVFRNKKSIWEFNLFSKGNKYSLLNSKWDLNFDTKSNVDTIQIGKNFTYSFTPLQRYDTIRFVIISENTKDGQRKSFYYQLPIECDK